MLSVRDGDATRWAAVPQVPTAGAEGGGVTLCDRVATYLKQRPDVWVDGRELSHIGGYAAWRTRISDLRRAPYGMQIENRVRTVETPQGKRKISEYVYRPAQAAQVA